MDIEFIIVYKGLNGIMHEKQLGKIQAQSRRSRFPADLLRAVLSQPKEQSAHASNHHSLG